VVISTLTLLADEFQAPYSLVRTGMISSNPYPGLPLHFGIVLDGGQPG